MQSYLLASIHDSSDYLPVSKPPIKLSPAASFNLKGLSPDRLAETSKVEPVALVQGVPAVQAESTYHEMMKKQQRRLYSWPSREVDEFEDDGVADHAGLIPRMRALESTAALSLATFTSLLIEFVARLDHLVDAVDFLAKMANFIKADHN